MEPARGNCLRRNRIPRSLFFIKEDSPTPKTTKTAPGKLQRLIYVVCPPASGWREQFCIDVGFPVSAAASICLHGAIGDVRIFRVADGLSIYGDHPPFGQNKLIGSSQKGCDRGVQGRQRSLSEPQNHTAETANRLRSIACSKTGSFRCASPAG